MYKFEEIISEHTKDLQKQIELAHKNEDDSIFVENYNWIIQDINNETPKCFSTNLRKILIFCENCIENWGYEHRDWQHAIRTGFYATEIVNKLQLKNYETDLFIIGICQGMLQCCENISKEDEKKLVDLIGPTNYYFSKQLIKYEDESHIDYIKRLKAHHWLTLIKIADIKEHLIYDKDLDLKAKEQYYEDLLMLL
jgi:hypothetical protein